MICWRNTPCPDTCGSYIHRLGYHPSFTKIKQCSGIVVKVGALLFTNINHQLTIVLWFEHRNKWFFPIAILRLWKPPGTKNTRNPSNPSSTQKNFGRKICWDKKSISFPNGNSLPRQKKERCLVFTNGLFPWSLQDQKTSRILVGIYATAISQKTLKFESTKKSSPEKNNSHLVILCDLFGMVK